MSKVLVLDTECADSAYTTRAKNITEEACEIIKTSCNIDL